MNCPNCGAPMKGSRCEYCGTEIAQNHSIKQLPGGLIELYGRKFYLTLDRIETSIYEPAKVYLTGVDVTECLTPPPKFFFDNREF